MPDYHPNSEEMRQVGLRSTDGSKVDVTTRLSDLLNTDFDIKTKRPPNIPAGFDPVLVMKLKKILTKKDET